LFEPSISVIIHGNAMEKQAAFTDAARSPLWLGYHPLYRFYEGGRRSRAFRGEPDRPDDWWSEDWVGSSTVANNPDPAGSPQGLSLVDVPGVGPVTLLELITAIPEAIIGAAFAERWGLTTGILVKLLSPSGQVPLHAHPNRDWALRHLGSPFGKTEGWILLDTPGDGREPAHAGIGFRPGIERDAFGAAVRAHDRAAVRDTLHRTDVAADEVYVAHGGVPHYLGPQISFIEIQEPTDHIVIPETDGADDSGATMGLGWDVALDMIDYQAVDRAATFSRARQERRLIRQSGASRETRLVHDDVLPFFDVIRLEIEDELVVEDGRFSIDIVTAGEGAIVGELSSRNIRRGDTFACAAVYGHRFQAGREPLTVIRCLGPSIS
jgi:mannose-6-phosphate isomerase